MTSRRTVEREGRWWLARVGETLQIARSDNSDWLTVPVREVEQLVADLRSLAAPEPIPEALDRD
jgi:acyl transferase domain-containing protein